MKDFTEARDFIIDEITKEVFGPEPIGIEIDTKEDLYFSKEDANITPGKSLLRKEINLSIWPLARIVVVVLILCNVNSDLLVSIFFPADLSSKAIK